MKGPISGFSLHFLDYVVPLMAGFFCFMLLAALIYSWNTATVAQKQKFIDESAAAMVAATAPNVDCVYLVSGEVVKGKIQYFFNGKVIQVKNDSGLVEFPTQQVEKVVKRCKE